MKKNRQNPMLTPPPRLTSAVDSGIHPVFNQFLQMIPENREFVFRFLDLFPLPVEIFAPDGTTVFLNKTSLEINNIPDAGMVMGKYNVLNDPVMNQMGLKDGIQRVFRGETVVFCDVDAPIQDLVDRGVTGEKPFEKSSMDWYLYPVMRGKKLTFVVFIWIVKKLYHGRPDLARARNYIDSHWQGEYNAAAVAKSVNMSVTQLYRLFKKYTGITPGDYHKLCKVDRIKEKLRDKNLSVKNAFAACGEDSKGYILQVFKEITGMTPTEFRENLE